MGLSDMCKQCLVLNTEMYNLKTFRSAIAVLIITGEQ